MCSVIGGLMALGGLMQYKQQQEQASAQASMQQAQAEAAEQNAHIERRKQEQIADAYAQKAADLRREHRLAQGRQRAQAGAAGIGMGGSQLDILSSGLEAYGLDQYNLLSNQRNDNFSSRVQETNFINDANASRASAKNVERQAKWQGLATILGTAASIYGAEQPWKKSAPQAVSPVDFGTISTSLDHGYQYDWNSTTGKATLWRPKASRFPHLRYRF